MKYGYMNRLYILSVIENMNFQLREIKNQNRPLRVFLVKVIRAFGSLSFTS